MVRNGLKDNKVSEQSYNNVNIIGQTFCSVCDEPLKTGELKFCLNCKKKIEVKAEEIRRG